MAKIYDKELVENIRNANDIVSVISENVVLRKRGKLYWGCCPFHNEKTPSFSVNTEMGIFHCFGCHTGGDIYAYLQKYYNISFPEAVVQLAQRANITLPELEVSPEDKKREQHINKIYEVNELAANFFHNCLLQTKMGQEAYAYFMARGLTLETIKSFRLGFAPPAWDKLYKAFKSRGISDKIMLEAGLIREGNQGNYDYFRNRVMFPIMDGRSRVVGFGGRVLDDSSPKYLNSQDREFFNKGKLLYAFDKAYKTIRHKHQVVLMEGYMDVLAAHNAGIDNVVASLGTAFTKNQASLLLRQADEIVVAYDMDTAGRAAARRVIEIAQDVNLKVRILSISDGKDPDEFIKKHGGEQFELLVKNSVTAFEFLLNEAMAKYDSNVFEGKISILQEVFPFIASTKSQAEQDGYIKALALPLYLDNAAIYKYFREFKAKVKISAKEYNVQSVPKATLEDKFLAMILSDNVILEKALKHINVDDFENDINKSIINKLMLIIQQDMILDNKALEEVLNEEERQALYKIMVLGDKYEESAFHNKLRAFKLYSLKRLYKKHSVLADNLSRADDPRFIEELKKCQEIQNEIQQWSRVI